MIDALRKLKCDIALLQETFLLEKDQLYIKGFRIFRADGPTRSKGVALLISTELDVVAVKVHKDRDGRFVKVRMRDNTSGISRTISSIYLEPTGAMVGTIISEIAMASDFIGGDLNNADTGMNRDGVYHLRNISLIDRLLVPKQVSDHPVISGRIHMTTRRISVQEEYRALNIEIVDSNHRIIGKAILGNSVNKYLVIRE